MGRGSGIDYAAGPKRREEKATSGVVAIAGQKGQERVLLVQSGDDQWQLPRRPLADGDNLLASAKEELTDLVGDKGGQLTEISRSATRDNLFVSKLRMTVPISSNSHQGRWFSVANLPDLPAKDVAIIKEAVASVQS